MPQKKHLQNNQKALTLLYCRCFFVLSLEFILHNKTILLIFSYQNYNKLNLKMEKERTDNMNNFIFENATKTYFGKGCVKEYLAEELSKYGNTILLAYGGGSIKKNGVYDKVVKILQSTQKNIIEFSGIMSNPTYAKV